MYLKTGFYILLSSLFLTIVSSCLGGGDENEYIVSTDAQIISFSLSHDSVPALAKTKFSIDQVKNEVYNHDSLPYLTNVYSRVKVAFTSGSGYSNLLTTSADGDSTWVSNGDSLDISGALAGGLKFKVYAPDGVTIKEYRLTINIHQVDPDSVIYKPWASNVDFLNASECNIVKFKGYFYAFAKWYIPSATGYAGILSLFQSTDMKTWELIDSIAEPANLEITNIQANENFLIARTHTEANSLYISDNGVQWNKFDTEYPIVSILGYLKPSATGEGGIAMIAKKDNSNIFYFTKNLYDFQEGTTIPDNFPVSGFSTISNGNLSSGKITIVGGKSQSEQPLNTVWATQNGWQWINLSSEPRGNLPSGIEGGSSILYNGEIWHVCGFLGGNYIKNIYYSQDGGLVWKTKETKVEAPEQFILRKNAFVITDDKGIHFYIAGGQNQTVNSVKLTDIWQVSLNAKIFEEQ
jgi:hypothetical protein